MTNPALPLVPPPQTAIPINRRFALSREGDLRVIFLDGQPVMEFHRADTAGRDLVMVQLCEHGGLTEGQVAHALAVSRPTVSRAKRKYGEGGVGALLSGKRGPTGPTKIKAYKTRLMISLAQHGIRKTEIATRLGVNESAVRKALRRLGWEELAVRQATLALDEAGADGGEAETTAVVGQESPELPPTAQTEECPAAMSQGGDPQAGGVDAPGERGETQGEAAAGGEQKAVEVALPVATSLDTDPENRSLDRALARAGLLDDAAPLFGTRCNVRSAGLLLAVPILVAHGVFADAVKIFGRLGPAFYGIRNTVASLLLMFLARINRPEHLKEHSPQALGAVLGLDRAPEMKTVRRKIRRLSGVHKSLEFMRQLTARHLARRAGSKLWLCVDGHVSVYSGKRKLSKHYVTRLRLSLPSVLDYWVNDERGEPVMVVTGVPKKGVAQEVPRLIEELRQHGEQRPVTVIFDREGWSPAMFARLEAMEAVCFLTYRKAKANEALPRLPVGAFASHQGEVDGQAVAYELADHGVYIDYGSGRKRKRLRLRQITRRRDTGDQTHIVTNDRTSSALVLAHRMFGRWSQENFFKYMDREMDFDGLLSYAMDDADGDRAVPNPARRKLAQRIHAVKHRLQELTRAYGERALENRERRHPTMRGFKIANGVLGQTIREVMEELDRLQHRFDSLPAKVPVRETLNGKAPQQVRVETRRLISCFRIAVFRAESALRELLRPHYRQWRQDGRTIIQSMLQSSGDLEVHPGELRVILTPQSAPHRTKALAILCQELNAFGTRFPGSDLRLRFSVRDHGNVS
jgi:transposase